MVETALRGMIAVKLPYEFTERIFAPALTPKSKSKSDLTQSRQNCFE